MSEENDIQGCDCGRPSNLKDDGPIELAGLTECPHCGIKMDDERELFAHIVIYHSC